MTGPVKRGDIEPDLVYEPGLQIEIGVTGETIGSKGILLGHTIYPPGNKNHWHTHTCEAAQYVIRGRIRELWVEDGEVKEAILGPGDFFYISAGDVHTQENASDTEELEIIFTYSGANSTESANTVFVDDPTGQN